MSSPLPSKPVSATNHTALERVAQTVLPTDAGLFDVHAYVDPASGTEYLALVLGDVSGRSGLSQGARGEPPLVRVHSECLTGDALGSHRCDCGDQLKAAQQAIAREGCGVVLYLRGHEGRGIGLGAKLQAYVLQDRGLDTVDANLALGLPADLRSYEPAAAMLKDLGVRRIRLMSSNPAKEEQLRQHGIDVVARISLLVPARPENARYLEAKRTRMGHGPALSAAPTFGAAPGTGTATGPGAEPGARSGNGDDTWRELVAGRVPTRTPHTTGFALAECYGPLVAAGERLVLAQLGQSLDGFIAARTGDAVFVTGDEDREHLHRLRALVDAVIVGVSTVVTDNCQLTVRAVEGPSPVRVLLDPNARAPRTATMLTDGVVPVLWCVASGTPIPQPLAPHVEVLQLPLTDGRFAPSSVLAALAARGYRRVLVEGGGRTVSEFLAAGALDRIFVTIAPLLIGDGVPGLRFDGTDRLSDALRAPSRRFRFGEDVCVELDLAADRGASAIVDGAAPAIELDRAEPAHFG